MVRTNFMDARARASNQHATDRWHTRHGRTSLRRGTTRRATHAPHTHPARSKSSHPTRNDDAGRGRYAHQARHRVCNTRDAHQRRRCCPPPLQAPTPKQASGVQNTRGGGRHGMVQGATNHVLGAALALRATHRLSTRAPPLAIGRAHSSQPWKPWKGGWFYVENHGGGPNLG